VCRLGMQDAAIVGDMSTSGQGSGISSGSSAALSLPCSCTEESLTESGTVTGMDLTGRDL